IIASSTVTWVRRSRTSSSAIWSNPSACFSRWRSSLVNHLIMRAFGAVLLLTVACASSRGVEGGTLGPRFVAVHNTLAAMGLAQIGPLREGTLAEGREVRVPLDLPAGCSTVVAMGGDGVRDIDATLLDASGRPVAHDTTNAPEAILRTCALAAEGHVLTLK